MALPSELTLNLPGLASGSSTTSTKASATASPFGAKINGVARVPNPQGVGISNVHALADANYDKQSRKQNLVEHSENQKEILDSATDRSQWFKLDPNWTNNYAKNRPEGNLNNRSFGTTLRQSRLADALNNSRHWKASNIGRRTNSSFGSEAAEMGHSERWEPVETQETRQMRANERIDDLSRQRAVGRAEDIKDYPLKRKEAMDTINSDLAKYQAQTGIDFKRIVQKAIIDAQYSKSWDTMYSSALTRLAMELGLDLKERSFQKSIELSQNLGGGYLSATVPGSVRPSDMHLSRDAIMNQIASVSSTPQEYAYASASADLLSTLSYYEKAFSGYTNAVGSFLNPTK